MAVKNGHLTCVYNLGDYEAEIAVQPLVIESNTEEAIMDQVKLERYKTHGTQLSFPKSAKIIFYWCDTIFCLSVLVLGSTST